MGERGRALNPWPLLATLIMHHAMGQALVIPMNLYYHDNRDYHEFVLLLQAAAFMAMALQNYGYTLDVSTKRGLMKMKITIAISWLAIVYSRVLRFVILAYRLARTFYADGNFTILSVAACVLILMGIFNAMLFMDATRKLRKFVFPPPRKNESDTRGPVTGQGLRTAASLF